MRAKKPGDNYPRPALLVAFYLLSKPNKEDTRPDSQKVADIAYRAADWQKKAKTQGEHYRTYQSTSRDQNCHGRSVRPESDPG
jgi:hypothetical protein